MRAADERRCAKQALGSWSKTARVGRLLGHGENTIFAVQGEPWVIRVHRDDYPPTPVIEGELVLVEALADAGFHVCRPVRTGAGAGLVNAEGRRVTVLERLVGRRQRQVGCDRARVLGATLARLHSFARDWQPPATFQRPLWDLEALIGPDAAWGSMESAGFDPGLAHTFRQAMRQVLRFDAPPIPVHHDLHGGNVLWDGDRPQILDWDDAGIGYPLFDVCIPAFRLAPARRDAFFQGYGRTWPEPITDAARIALDARVLGWLHRRADVPGFDVALSNAMERVERRIRAWLDRDPTTPARYATP